MQIKTFIYVLHERCNPLSSLMSWTFFSRFCARKQLLLSALLSYCNSVCLSVHHTGGSAKNGAS